MGLISVWNSAARSSSRPRSTPPGRAEPPARDGLPAGDRLLPGDRTDLEGLMEVLVSNPAARGGPYRCRAQRISVTGGLFTYEADHTLSGPVRERTWTVEPGAWRLTVPPAA
ncbi:hypothetical protein GXW82_34295 [Streptacidiphilus sp. 4-A2]|nr:hypothetical protein [Streptacidiphilus sp. 4-A2]